MIKVKADFTPEPFNAIRAEIDDFDATTAKVGKRVIDATEQSLLSALQVEPGPVKKPIQWTSERQRKAYFATNGFGRGIPTGRSGRMAKRWQVKSAIQSGRFTITVINDSPGAQFVYGTLNMRSFAEAMRPKQQFHINTGWLNAQPIVKQFTETARKETERGLNKEIELIKVRIQRRSRRR